DDGRWLRIQAAAEPVVEIRHQDPGQVVRLAWHLGNRHLPTEIQNQVLRIRPDHVIEGMLRGFGADLARVQTAFQPEGGAYGGNDHHHSHDETEHHHESWTVRLCGGGAPAFAELALAGISHRSL